MTDRNLKAFGIAFVAVALGVFAGCDDWTMPAADPTAETDSELVALRDQLETLVAEQGQARRAVEREKTTYDELGRRMIEWSERPDRDCEPKCPMLSVAWPPLLETRVALNGVNREINALKVQIAEREAALDERK